jgi:hypothetical protein
MQKTNNILTDPRAFVKWLLLSALAVSNSTPNMSYAQLAPQNTTVARSGLEAHEWGTFTSLVGSNGITQNGMYHEDEVLPDFVHNFGYADASLASLAAPSTILNLGDGGGLVSQNEASTESSSNIPRPSPTPCPRISKGCMPVEYFENNIVTQKMETPVIYFHAAQQMRVNVDVRFPEGVITETYPGPVRTFPTLQDPKVIANGRSEFDILVTPFGSTKGSFGGGLPAVDPGNIYSHARNVVADLVRSGSEQERFIFYRGLGRFQPRIGISSRLGQLRMFASESDTPSFAMLVDVDRSGDARGLNIHFQRTKGGNVSFISQTRMNRLRDHSRSQDKQIFGMTESRQLLVDALTNEGLNHDEANAMVSTWEAGYLKTPGLRLLYVLPRTEVDSILPLTITPTPDRTVRAFVGRLEVLIDTDEQRILDQILAERNAFDILSLGRMAEPILRRVAEIYQEQQHAQLQKPEPAIVNLLNALIARAAAGSGNASATGSTDALAASALDQGLVQIH